MKYKVRVYDESNTVIEAIVDTETLNIQEEDWFLLTSDERESMLLDEMYTLSQAFCIVAMQHKQVT